MIELPQPLVYNKRLAYFGGFHPTKGVGVLLQAMRRLPDYQLLMFSNVPKDLMDGRRMYGHPNVFVMGGYRRDELPCLVGLADVVVVPSLFESFGLCAREAEAAGAKVISTRTGGLSGTVEPGNTEALVEAILNA
jgi:D-inositol-3-phosphate glycosyltransferase